MGTGEILGRVRHRNLFLDANQSVPIDNPEVRVLMRTTAVQILPILKNPMTCHMGNFGFTELPSE